MPVGVTLTGAQYALANLTTVVGVNKTGGSAVAGTNYSTTFPTSITFNPTDGVTTLSKNLTVAVLDDNTYNPPGTTLGLGLQASGATPPAYALGAQTSNTLTIANTDPVPNTAPTLSGANNFSSILEDNTTSAGTLVSALVAGQITDPDAGALAGIAITATDTTHGSWEYSLNNGGSWSPVGAVTGGQSLLLPSDANTRVRFVPAANFNGTVTNGITFRAWDQSSGTAGTKVDTSTNGGSTAFSSATASSSITVTSVNDAPVGTSTTVTTLEDTAFVFAPADFGFTDPSDTPRTPSWRSRSPPSRRLVS
ncbi:MAG: hypothetical protein JWO38_141 [Gemmataceae bacterium]|nr:hypothetical protein [Gemmataceae bacterium]